MVRRRNISLILPFLIFLPFILCSASAGFSMPAEDAQREVIKLFQQSEFIPQVRITPAGKDRFVVELSFNIGDRWGRDGFVRDLAKAAMVKVYKSNLPVAQGIVKVYWSYIEAIHLAIGVNQAEQMNWEDSPTPSEFFDRLRSCARWGKRPEDRTYFIEHRQIIKPSPIVSLPPDS